MKRIRKPACPEHVEGSLPKGEPTSFLEDSEMDGPDRFFLSVPRGGGADEFGELEGMKMGSWGGENWSRERAEDPKGSQNRENPYGVPRFKGFRLKTLGKFYWIGHLYANGRQIAQWEQFAYEDTGGCSISTKNRLKYANFPALFLNFLMLLLPLLLIVLIRGWFFTKSWRKHRVRNTLIVLLLAVFTIHQKTGERSKV